MDTDAIVTPILKAINDLRDEVRENRRDIQNVKEELREFKKEMTEFKEEMYEFKEEMYEFKDEMTGFKEETNRHFEKIELEANKRWEAHEEEIIRERKYIKDILVSFQTSVEDMYGENKTRIDKLEERLNVVNA